MATFSSPEFGKADFVLLDEVTEEHFMRNLKLRFQKGKIYTYIGKGVSRLRLCVVSSGRILLGNKSRWVFIGSGVRCA